MYSVLRRNVPESTLDKLSYINSKTKSQSLIQNQNVFWTPLHCCPLEKNGTVFSGKMHQNQHLIKCLTTLFKLGLYAKVLPICLLWNHLLTLTTQINSKTTKIKINSIKTQYCMNVRILATKLLSIKYK